jgi:hypothetical protein
MKLFWLAVVLLVGGAIYLVLTPGRPAGIGGQRPSLATTPATPPAPSSSSTPSNPAQDSSTRASASVESAPSGASAPAPSPPPISALPAAVSKADAVKAEMALSITESLGGSEGIAGSISTGEVVMLPDSPRHAKEALVPATAKRVPIAGNPGLKIDDEFLVAGSGTRQDPYVVSLEHLASVANLYNPRKGLNKLPQRVTFMDGAWVKIVGYIAFPVSATDATELLVMQNQWDGCCIGVPPTAYDAVEVKLASAVRGAERFSTFGSVVGKLKVDPYIDANWLLGLYVMEEGQLFSEKTDASLQTKHNQP